MNALAAAQLDALKDAALIRTSSHRYFLGPVELPSLNRIMKAGGLADDFSAIPPAILERKRYIGEHVHKACELYLRGDLDEATIWADALPYFEGFKRYHDSIGNPKARAIETPVCSREHLFACTPDIEWDCDGGVDEIKTSVKLSGYIGAQTAAQVLCISGKNDRRRGAIQLKKDGTFAYKPLGDPDDFHAFLGALSVFRFKETRKLLGKSE